MALAALALSLVLAASGQDEMALGLAAEKSGDFIAARRHLEAAVHLFPNLAVAQVELFDVLVRAEETGPALQQALEGAERVEPTNPRVWRLEGTVFETRGDRPKAMAAYEKSIALRGDDGSTHFRLGNLYAAAARADDALAQYRVASSLNPYDHLARLALADALVAHGDLAGAETELKVLVAQVPKSPGYQKRLHDVRVKLGKASPDGKTSKRKLRPLAPSTR